MIVILGYINKIYLIWFNIQPNWLWGSGPDTDEMPSWAPAITTLISLWRLSSHLFSAIIVLIWKSWIAAKLEHKSVFTSGWSISINVAAKDACLLRPTQISFFVLWSESDFGCFENTVGTIQYLSTSACQKSAVVSGCEWGRAQFVQHALTPELSKNNVFFFFWMPHFSTDQQNNWISWGKCVKVIKNSCHYCLVLKDTLARSCSLM